MDVMKLTELVCHFCRKSYSVTWSKLNLEPGHPVAIILLALPGLYRLLSFHFFLAIVSIQRFYSNNFEAGLGVTERIGTGREKMGGQDNRKAVQDQAAEAMRVLSWDPLPLQCQLSCSLGQADHTSTSNRR